MNEAKSAAMRRRWEEARKHGTWPYVTKPRLFKCPLPHAAQQTVKFFHTQAERAQHLRNHHGWNAPVDLGGAA